MEGFWRVLEGLGGFRRVLEGCGGFERFWRVQQDFGGFWRVVHGFCRVFGSFVSSANKFKSNKNFEAFAIITTIFFLSILNIEFARSYNIQSNQTCSLLGDFGNI